MAKKTTKKTLKFARTKDASPIGEKRFTAKNPRSPKSTGEELTDLLGALRARKQPIEADMELFRLDLIKLCRKRDKAFNGENYRSTISFQYNCETLDVDMVRKLLTPKQLAKCTRYGDKVTVNIYALPK